MVRRGPASPVSGLWHNRDFMILWSGETVSQLGSSMSFFVFPLVGYALTGSTTAAALAGTAFSLGSVVLRLPAGALVDRWDRTWVMVTASALGAVLYASLAAAQLAHALTLVHLVAVAFVTGLVGCFFGPAETAAIRRVVPPEQLPTAFSQNQARQHVAALVGPPLGGALFTVARAVPFLVDAVSYLLASVAVTRIRTPLPPPERAEQPARLWQDVVEGLRYVWAKGFLRAIVLFASLANFAGSALLLVMTLKLLRAGVHPAAIGLVDTIAAVAGITGSVLAPSLIRRVPTGRLTIGMGLVFVMATAPMAFTNSPVIVGALLAVALLGNPAGNAAISSYMVATVPDRLQGRANSALSFCAMSLQPVGPLLGGLLLGWFGGGIAMLLTAGLIGVSVLPILASRDVRTLPTPDQWPLPDTVDVPVAEDPDAGDPDARAPAGADADRWSSRR